MLLHLWIQTYRILSSTVSRQFDKLIYANVQAGYRFFRTFPKKTCWLSVWTRINLRLLKLVLSFPIYTVSVTRNARRRVSCQLFDCSDDHKDKLQHVSKHSIVTVPREDVVDETRSAFAEEQPGRPICTVKNRKRIRYQTYTRGRLPVDDLVAIANW